MPATWRSRRAGSGCAAGVRRASPIASRSLACKIATRGHTEARTRCRLGRPRGSASGVSAPVGARDGSRKRRTLQGRIRRSIRCCAVAAAHANYDLRLLRWSATSGRVPGTCCTWTSRSSAASRRRATPSQGTAHGARPAAGWEYVHSIIDDCSRLAYSEIHDDETAATVTAFTRRALDWFLEQGIVCERVMTDNAFAYTRSRSFKQLLWQRAITHIRTRPYTPRTNGKVERFHQTLMREWAYALQYASSDARQEALPHWINHYNERRTHSALGNRPPRTRVRDVTGHNTPLVHRRSGRRSSRTTRTPG